MKHILTLQNSAKFYLLASTTATKLSFYLWLILPCFAYSIFSSSNEIGSFMGCIISSSLGYSAF